MNKEFPMIYTWPSEWKFIENLKALGGEKVFYSDGVHTSIVVNKLCAELLLNVLCNEKVPKPKSCCTFTKAIIIH